MESLKEFLDSLIRATRERFLNPLYVAFIVSWLVVNYEVVLILFGSDNAAEKIRFIDEVLFPQERDIVINGILRPLAAALVYVLVSPYIYRSVMKYAREREKETVRQLLAVAEETPLSPEAAERIRLGARLASAKAKQEREKLETEIEDLNSRLSSVMDENDRLRKALSNSSANTSGNSPIPPDDSVAETAQEDGELDEEMANSDHTDTHESPDSTDSSNAPSNNSPLSSPIVAGQQLTSRPVRFSPDDFPGYSPKERHYLVERGLSEAELELLYKIRNTPVLTVNRLIEKQQFDFNEAKTVLDLFERMSLLESKQYRDQNRTILGYALTGLARMALMAAKSRGLLPTSEG